MSKLFGKTELAISFDPISAFPVDARSHFDSLDEMESAAKSAVEKGSADSSYYFGQLITLSFDNNTKSDAYLIVKEDSGTEEGGKTVRLARADEVGDINIALDVTQKASGLTFVGDKSLCIKLTENSGLNISEDGLSIKPDNTGNIIISTTENGTKAEYCWAEYDMSKNSSTNS